MKISDEEVKAAAWAWDSTWDSSLTPRGIECMRLALAAAYTVRKARKAAKRAKAKPSILDEDQQEALRQVNLPQFTVSSKTISAIFDRWKADIEAARQTQTEPVKPAWNGKFEVGKAYRTRDGQKATITDIRRDLTYCLRGLLPNCRTGWTDTGKYAEGETTIHDLIGPWED